MTPLLLISDPKKGGNYNTCVHIVCPKMQQDINPHHNFQSVIFSLPGTGVTVMADWCTVY